MREEMSEEKGKTRNNNGTVVESGIISAQLYDNLKLTISRVLEYMGRYQIALCIAFLFNGWIYGINHNLPAFHIYTPAFFCKVRRVCVRPLSNCFTSFEKCVCVLFVEIIPCIYYVRQ